MPSQSTNVFVSYSHADASLVAPVVKLLRVNKSLVFQDVDDIQPGKRWRSEIAKGITKSHLVVVFWCNHASQSAEVSKEWKAAIEQEKDLLPLLLDATPLPSELGQFQWIDFRGTVGANHGSIVFSQRMALPPAPVRSARCGPEPVHLERFAGPSTKHYLPTIPCDGMGYVERVSCRQECLRIGNSASASFRDHCSSRGQPHCPSQATAAGANCQIHGNSYSDCA